MKRKSWGVFSLLVCAMAAVSLTASVSHGGEVFVVAADSNADANYMASNGDGTFASQEPLQLVNGNGISGYSYGNGIGDFDNDGDLDYITATGLLSGSVYLFENVGFDPQFNQFAEPVIVGSWNGGFFPMDMAVADFNEDGNLDFVMSSLYSTDCGLYLGDGNLGFTHVLLPEYTAPDASSGADAGDFNNDGHADFVIAPYSNEPFYINLGNGDGTFTTLTFPIHADAPFYYGVAAADFDNDGNTDLVATYTDVMHIYRGTGDGETFEYAERYDDGNISLSPVDSYDFNGDGNEDLVVGNYGADGTGVAVFLGNGVVGNPDVEAFSYLATYWGGGSGQRYALSALPLELNKAPVAVVNPAYVEVTAGDEVVFDASESYDEDGEIVSYAWDFGDGQETVGLMAANSDADGVTGSHTYYDTGMHTVTLTVTDDKGATASFQAEVNVVPVDATIRFIPRRLHLKSRGKWIWAIIRLPDGYDAGQIDPASVCIVLENAPPIFAHTYSRHGFSKKWKNRHRKWRRLTVRFDRQAVIGAIPEPSDETILNVEGKMRHNGGDVAFAGSGTIKTIKPNPGRFRRIMRFIFSYFR